MPKKYFKNLSICIILSVVFYLCIFSYDDTFLKISEQIEENFIEDDPSYESNSTLIDYYHNLELNKSRSEKICELPVLEPWTPKIRELIKKTEPYNKCEKKPPLTYIVDNVKLFISQEVNKTFFKGQITHCSFAPVIRSAVEKEHFVLGDYSTFFY